MEPRFNLWIEAGGEVATSRWRMELLASIEAHGSISAGAREMGVAYRVAWQKIHEMEERLGVQLLETRTGGVEGGGAHLTEAGRDHIERMRVFCDRADRAVREAYSETFGSSQSD